ncbi:hypothetical protein [Tenacibaculum maritimum]|uniref:hypothetical protein n=1 Tax=Tenacibaculum maritimum TaxID=107401 RepID=UPI00132F6BE7|nr:hypothetical protein [Tenacibaculum maritimum]
MKEVWSILTNSFSPNLPKPTIVFCNVAGIFYNVLKVAEVIFPVFKDRHNKTRHSKASIFNIIDIA